MEQKNKWIALAVILMAPLLTVIDVYIVNMALPTMKTNLIASDSSIELVVSAYLVGYCVFLVTGGRAGDYFGHKRLFFLSMAAFTLSSALCGFSAHIWQLIGFRFLQGISAALMVPQTLTMMQIMFRDEKERAKAFGYYGVTLGIASILGQYLGGFLTASEWIHEGWRLIFLINLPLGVITLLFAWFYLPKTKPNNEGKFDLSGTIILTFALSGLIYGLTKIPETGLSVYLLGILMISISLLVIFYRNQHRKTIGNQAPLLNTSLFKIKSFNMVLLVAVFFWGAHNSYLLMCGVQFQNSLQLDTLSASSYFAFNGIGFLISSLIAFRFLPKYGIKLLIGGGFLMTGSILLQLTYLNSSENVKMIPYLLFLYGLGQGTLLPSILNYALKKIPVEHAAAAGGVYVTVQQFSSALGISVIGSIFFYAIRHHYNGYMIGMSMAAGYLCLSILALYLLSRLQVS